MAEGPDAGRRRVRVIVNPYATSVSERLRGLVVHALRGRYDVDMTLTQAPGHATALAREAAADGTDAVVAFGGDGTVSEAANGLAGTGTPLTCLPGGAQNVYAKLLGIPADVIDATEHLIALDADWRPRRVDLGRVNDRHFVFSAGLGLDAAVVRRVDANPAAKARMRHWYYAAAGLHTFLTDYARHPPCIDVAVDGQTVRGVTTLVQIADAYTFWGPRPLHVADEVTLDDGTMAGIVLQRVSPIDVPAILTRLFTRLKMADHRRIVGWSGATSLTCTSADGRPVPLQVDGDHVGDVVDARFEVLPRALTVIA
jgi:diacylglycerol kinase family enzyme